MAPAAAPAAPAAPVQTIAQLAQPAPAAPASLGGAIPAGPGQSVAPAAPAPAAAPAADPAAVLAQTRAELARAQAAIAQNQPFIEVGRRALAQQYQANPGAAPAAPATPANPFGLPPFNPADAQWIIRDADGNVSARPGAPAGVVDAYIAHQANLPYAASRFLSDPRAALEPIIRELAAAESQRATQAALGEVNQKVVVDGIMADFETFGIQKNPAGEPIMEFNYQTARQEHKFTPLGEVYYRAANEIASMGMKDPSAIHKYAKAHVDAVKAKMGTPAAPAAVPALGQTLGQTLGAPANVPGPGAGVNPHPIAAFPGSHQPPPRLRDQMLQIGRTLGHLT